jgi:hypothetical protein
VSCCLSLALQLRRRCEVGKWIMGAYIFNNGSCIRNGDRVPLRQRAGTHRALPQCCITRWGGLSRQYLPAIRRRNMGRMGVAAPSGCESSIFCHGPRDREHLPRFLIRWCTKGNGWGQHQIRTQRSISLDSKSIVFQAGQDPPNPYINVFIRSSVSSSSHTLSPIPLREDDHRLFP